MNFDEDFTVNGFDRNWANQIAIEKAGFKVIPVIHDFYSHEPQFYIDKGYDLVAIGSGELRNGSA